MRQSLIGLRGIVRAMQRVALVAPLALFAESQMQTASAQVQSVVAPIFSSIDAAGVDASTGKFFLSSTEVVVGNPAAGGLVHGRGWVGSGWRDALAGTISNSGSVYTVSVGARSESFTLSGGTYSSDQHLGSTLTYASSKYTYTLSDGTAVEFDTSVAGCSGVISFWACSAGTITKLTRPDGEILTWTYTTASVGGQTARRPQSISNNLGYQIHFTYADDSPANTTELNGDWLKRTKVTGINRAYYYCADTAYTCSDSTGGNWTYVTYGTESGGAIETVTDRLSQVTRYVFSSGLMTNVRLPSSSSTNRVMIAYNSGSVSNVQADVNLNNYYTYSDAAGIRTTTIAPYAEGQAAKIKTDLANGRVTEMWADSSGNRKTVLTRDGYGRVTRATRSDGDYTNLTYDGRGNVTQVDEAPKTGSGLTTITTTASYPGSCSSPKTCNKPTSTTNARGYRTDFTYDASHGGVTAITAPAPAGSAPVGSGTRPEMRFSYSALYAWYKNSGGSLVSSGSSVYRPTETSACATGSVSSSCVATSDETRTIVAYESGSSSVPSNLLPITMTARSGNTTGSGAVSSSSTMTYTVLGDLATIDGALSGSTDTSSFYYDDVRRMRASVSPDPDGGGSLQHRVSRTTYDADDQTSVSEAGYTSAPSGWASMTVLQREDRAYLYGSMLSKSALSSGGTTYSVVQFGVGESFSRCAALRMNPSEFASLPSDGCSLDATGSYGPDRLWLAGFNSYAEGANVIDGVAVAPRTLRSAAYAISTGALEYLTDAAGNETAYTYDDFFRLKKTIYPDPSTPGSQNAGDYEELTYNSTGQITAHRGRDGNSFSFVYDNLSRVTSRDAPGSQPDISYTYDNFGRVLTISQSGHTLTYVYDALGRVTSETQAGRTVSYQYDEVGRRTRMTWPDSFYVTYDYNTVGEVTAIRENGATSGPGVLATFYYDNLGQLTSYARGNASVTQPVWDAVSRLDSLAHDLAGSSNDYSADYDYNPAGQIVSKTVSSAYNFTLPSAYTDTYAANGLNRYTSASGITPTYNDSRGNMTYDGNRNYSYDYDNRMTGAGSTTMSYDPDDRLYQVAAGTTTQFLYDGADVIAEYVSGSIVRRYVHGPGLDQPLVWYEGAGTTDRRYLFADERGSIVAVEGGSTMINTYDEYGVPGSGNSGRYQYTGQLWLSEVGLYYYKARFYSPELGRFMQADPIGYSDGMNLYAYVGSDPMNLRDPSGLQTAEPKCPEPPLIGDCVQVDGDKPQAKGGWVSGYLGLVPYGSGAWRASELSPEQEQAVPQEAARDQVDIFAKPYSFQHRCAIFCAMFGGEARNGGYDFRGTRLGLDVAGQTMEFGLTVAPIPGFAGTAAERIIVTGVRATTRASAYGGLRYAAQYGIKSYGALRASLKSTGLQAHHLIEQRFASVMGEKVNNMLSVAVTKAEHQQFTNAWRAAIPYGNGTANATRQQVMNAASQIYANYPGILAALGF